MIIRQAPKKNTEKKIEIGDGFGVGATTFQSSWGGFGERLGRAWGKVGAKLGQSWV